MWTSSIDRDVTPFTSVEAAVVRSSFATTSLLAYIRPVARLMTHPGVGRFRPTDNLPWIIDRVCSTVTASQIAKVDDASTDEHDGIGLRVAGQIGFACDDSEAVDAVGSRHVPAERSQILQAMGRVPKERVIVLLPAGCGGDANHLSVAVVAQRKAVNAAKGS